MATITVDLDAVTMVLGEEEITRERARLAIDEIVWRYEEWIDARGYECEVIADYHASGARRAEPDWRHEVADAVLIGQVDAIRAAVLDKST